MLQTKCTGWDAHYAGTAGCVSDLRARSDVAHHALRMQTLGALSAAAGECGSKHQSDLSSQSVRVCCRQWMRDVLQPLNEKAADIVVKHADMLQSNRMEPLLLQLVAHVSAYRVILSRHAFLRVTHVSVGVAPGRVVSR